MTSDNRDEVAVEVVAATRRARGATGAAGGAVSAGSPSARTGGESLRDLVVSKLVEKAAEHDRGHHHGRGGPSRTSRRRAAGRSDPWTCAAPRPAPAAHP